MKVVLFCGGLGLRLREARDGMPKPMSLIGPRPILWHVMRYYAHFGHRDFVLCLGYRGDAIKDYFLHYNEALSNDFVLSDGGKSLEFLKTDIQDWRITFVDTGLRALVGERLRAVRHHLDGEELFLANYGDTLTDAPLDDLIADFQRRGAIAAFLCARPTYTFHLVSLEEDGLVSSIQHVQESDTWINGGYFMFRREIFDYLDEGHDLVEEGFRRLIEAGQLIAYRHEGFWAPMDTLKDRQALEEMYESGRPPWGVWMERHPPAAPS
jgi:glucose-1-phosphate cytidylyltransferase